MESSNCLCLLPGGKLLAAALISGLTEFRRQTTTFVQVKLARMQRRTWKARDIYRKKLWRSIEEYLQVLDSILICSCLRKKNHMNLSKELSGSSMSSTIQNLHKLENNSYSHKPEWKGLYTMDNGQCSRKVPLYLLKRQSGYWENQPQTAGCPRPLLTKL